MKTSHQVILSLILIAIVVYIAWPVAGYQKKGEGVYVYGKYPRIFYMTSKNFSFVKFS